MCETALISKDIIRLGTRSYRHRLEALAPNGYRVETLRRLNHDLDEFYEFLYAQCNSVTETDYKVFGNQLDALLATLKSLHVSCKRMPKSAGMEGEADRLRMNYSALYELNEDIKNFRIKASNDAEWVKMLSDAGAALKMGLFSN